VTLQAILVVKLSSIGDVVHTIPSVLALRARYPDARLDWLVGAAAAPIVTALSGVDRALIAEERPTLRRRGFRYDLAIDFQGLLRSSVETLRSGARLRAGRGRWPWLHVSVPMYDAERTPHAVENTARVLGALDIPFVFDADALSGWAGSLRSRGEELAREQGLPRPFVAWFPKTRWASKDLPLDEVARFPGAAHVLLGSPAIPAAPPIAAAPPLRNLTGRLPLLDSVAIALAADRVVAADTGPAHLAALLGARIAGCFGPTRAARTGLRGPSATNVESSCGGCYRRRCGRAATCMREALGAVTPGVSPAIPP